MTAFCLPTENMYLLGVLNSLAVNHFFTLLGAQVRDAKAEVRAWEREIDQMVYQLYGLTEEEIKIVEGEQKS